MNYVESLLGEDEEIFHVSRQHWFVMVRSSVDAILFASVVTGISGAVFFFSAGVYLLPALGVLVLLIIPMGKVAIDWLRWRSRSLVVTNRRVIQVEGVFSKNVLDSSLEKVNDISMEQSIWGRLFDYGDLEILTASETGANRFDRIAHPVRCKTAMLDQKLLLEHEPSSSSATDIPTQIAKLAALKEKGIITPVEFEAKKSDLLKRM